MQIKQMYPKPFCPARCAMAEATPCAMTRDLFAVLL